MNRKLIIVGAAAAVTLLGAGGGAFMLFSSGAQAKGSGHGATVEAGVDKPGMHGEGASPIDENFIDVPAIVVNLRSPDGAARYLKLHFMLVPGAGSDPAALRNKLPLLLDSYQPFLRELRPEDLAGSAAVFRIKEELLIRAAATMGEGAVKDILIEDLVQQ